MTEPLHGRDEGSIPAEPPFAADSSSGREGEHSAVARPVRPLTGRDVLAAFWWGFVAPILVIVVGLLAAGKLLGPQVIGLSGIVVALFAASVLMLVGVHHVVVRRGGFAFADIGFTRPTRSLLHLLWEVPVVMGLALACAGLARNLLPLDDAGAATSSLNGVTGALPLVLATASVVVLDPIVEESLFRGVLYGWLRERLPVVWTVVLVGAFFGLIHVAPAAIAYLLPWGIGATALRAWHGSVWASLIAHVVNNAFVTGIVLANL